MEEPHGSKRKRGKHSVTKFSDEWIKIWPCLRRGRDQGHALCSVSLYPEFKTLLNDLCFY